MNDLQSIKVKSRVFERKPCFLLMTVCFFCGRGENPLPIFDLCVLDFLLWVYSLWVSEGFGASGFPAASFPPAKPAITDARSIPVDSFMPSII